MPILLIQRQTHFYASPVITSSSQELISGWDIIVPSSHSLALWRSLSFAGARAMGLYERENLFLEAGIPSFPRDYPETKAYIEWTARIRDQEREKWEKRPKSKRVNYELLNIKNPFESLFSHLVDKQECIKLNEEIENDDGNQMELSSNEENLTTLPTPVLLPLENRPVTVLHNSNHLQFLKQKLPESISMSDLDRSFKSKFDTKFSLDSCFIRVRIQMLGRGSPADRAIIYTASDAQYTFWIDKLNKSRNLKHDKISNYENWEEWVLNSEGTEPDESINDLKIPSEDSIIGYATSAGYSLSVGTFTTIACCVLTGLLDHYRSSQM